MQPDVWAVWPTVNIERSQERSRQWCAKGYRVAILVNPPHDQSKLFTDQIIVQPEWKGFPVAANLLCRQVPGNIVVVVGDDVHPDPSKTAQEIGAEFLARFPDTMGVMQPTGDKFGSYNQCAVSPWIGRKFIQEAYQGRGPFWEGYYHYFSDEELQAMAQRLNCFQQREDLNQFHDHWQRKDPHGRPQYLITALRRWRFDRTTFRRRKADGFPCR